MKKLIQWLKSRMISTKRQNEVRLGDDCVLSYKDGSIKVTNGSGTPHHSATGSANRHRVKSSGEDGK